jgi:predicted TIM-barrel fold metal-dependent hydrolase
MLEENTMAKGDAARIRQRIGHPILDGDGHWIESLPVLVDYVRDVGGTDMADRYAKSQGRRGDWYEAPLEERQNRRLRRGNWWITTADTTDFASGMLPGYLVERMDELGLDFAIIYPTRCLTGNSLPQEDMRRVVCRAYNNMVADVFGPHSKRLTPAALVPCFTPEEAIDEIEHAKGLGLKAFSFKGSLPRPIPAFAGDGASTAGVPYYVDALGLDNPYDYDKLWQRCVDLGVAVTVHQGSGWVDRMSYSNGEFNRVGHAAQAHDPLTKALFLGGVARRFPQLTFSFLEGGVGYAVMLLSGLIGGWEKRRYESMKAHLRPSNLDTQRLRSLIDQYGYDGIKSKGEEAITSLGIDDLTARETEYLDDYALLQVNSPKELADLFARNFYFGCEADDATTSWAFDPRMPGRLKAMLGSDISHWDVTDFSEVIPEVWEMVEHGLITEADLRDFTFANPVRLHCQMNPDFFEGTIVEEAAAQEMVPMGMLAASPKTPA